MELMNFIIKMINPEIMQIKQNYDTSVDSSVIVEKDRKG